MRSFTQQQQSGFTLIELIIVIVIIGILAAVAIPKFIDLKADADEAAVAGIAGSLSSAAASNFAVASIPGKATSVATCTAVLSLVQPAVDATEFVPGGTCVAAPGSTACTITKAGITKNFFCIITTAT